MGILKEEVRLQWKQVAQSNLTLSAHVVPALRAVLVSD